MHRQSTFRQPQRDGLHYFFRLLLSTAVNYRIIGIAPANVSATLTEGTTYWTLKLQNGEQGQFDNTGGNLTTIIDRNGNTTQLSYDTMARLVTITDPASR